jgi:hypothetical protein
MQRLTQNNSGARLPLREEELLGAWASQTLPDLRWYIVRMRLAKNGEAERSVHLHKGKRTAYQHEGLALPPESVAAAVAAVREAFRERESFAEREEDSQAVYRVIWFRDGDAPPRRLAVEYEDGEAVGPAASFEAAWRLLAGLFPSTRVGQGGIADLRW